LSDFSFADKLNLYAIRKNANVDRYYKRIVSSNHCHLSTIQNIEVIYIKASEYHKISFMIVNYPYKDCNTEYYFHEKPKF